jgi:hypothetical protein
LEPRFARLIKGRKEADSETIRDSTWETYKVDLRSRLKVGLRARARRGIA